MKKLFLSFTLCFLVYAGIAQSKTPPASRSALVGVSLPAGSRTDTRMLSTTSAKMLMNIVCDPAGTRITNQEVLALPVAGQTTYNLDSLLENLKQLGWQIEAIQKEDDFAWLGKNGNWVLMYYKEQKKQTDLYFAQVDRQPQQLASGNTNPSPSSPNSGPIPPPAPVSGPALPVNNQTMQENPAPPAQQQPPSPVSNGYQFNTTNFDDGWTAVEESDWVRVTKGAITVLLHYDHYKVDYSSMDRDIMTRNAWNVIVAPRYANLRNFFMCPNVMTSEAPSYCSGTLSDAKGDHFVVLFRKGRKDWIEFIAPDKASFEREFGIREDQMSLYMDLDLWNRMKDMYGKNYFAVAASDLPGHWTTNFFGMTQYYNTYTGLNAGATSHSSYQEYIIAPDLSYSWSLSMATGWVGAQKFDGAKSKGKVSMVNNWTAHFSDLEGKPKDYPVYFTAFKGGRKLWIYGQGYLKKL